MPGSVRIDRRHGSGSPGRGYPSFSFSSGAVVSQRRRDGAQGYTRPRFRALPHGQRPADYLLSCISTSLIRPSHFRHIQAQMYVRAKIPCCRFRFSVVRQRCYGRLFFKSPHGGALSNPHVQAVSLHVSHENVSVQATMYLSKTRTAGPFPSFVSSFVTARLRAFYRHILWVKIFVNGIKQRYELNTILAEKNRLLATSSKKLIFQKLFPSHSQSHT